MRAVVLALAVIAAAGLIGVGVFLASVPAGLVVSGVLLFALTVLFGGGVKGEQ